MVLVITGGNDGQGEYFNETEFISINGTVTVGPDLPRGMSAHKILSINETFSMLIGGVCDIDKIETITNETWYYDHRNSDPWIPGSVFKTGSGFVKTGFGF